MRLSEVRERLNGIGQKLGVNVTVDSYGAKIQLDTLCPSPNLQSLRMDLPEGKGWGKSALEMVATEVREHATTYNEWKAEQRRYQNTTDYRYRRAKSEVRALALRAGLEHDEHGGTFRGDYFTLRVLDVAFKSSELKRCHASGNLLGLAEQERKRVYASSSQWKSSTRADVFVVGTNENGVPFAHQVPTGIRKLEEAMEWIWNGAKIIHRQGDVGLASGTLKNKAGEHVEAYRILDSHLFTGEIHVNGSMHVRNGILYHAKNQHPAIEVGPEFMRVVIARRSQRGMSSRD